MRKEILLLAICYMKRLVEKYYLPNIDLAIERAKGFAPGDQLLEKIGSNLWELIELLRKNSSGKTKENDKM